MNLFTLNAIASATLDSQQGREIVVYTARCQLNSVLVAEFRYLHKKTSYWHVLGLNGRHIRSKYEMAMRNHCMKKIDVQGY